MRHVRPTLAALADLGIKRPALDVLLEDFGHVVLNKANEMIGGGTEPIREIDDNRFWKVKVQNWRGAQWADMPLASGWRDWLVAAGHRQEGSPDDFYAELAETGRRERASYNRSNRLPLKTDTYTAKLLPGELDKRRLLLEAGMRLLRDVQRTMRRLTRSALETSAIQEAAIGANRFHLRVKVEQPDFETYVAIRFAEGWTPPMISVLLGAVPGVDVSDWQVDTSFGGAPVSPEKGETVWSAILPPSAAVALLDE